MDAMYWVFLACAVFGGTIMICQLALALIGLGGHDMEIPDSIGTDVPHDFGGLHESAPIEGSHGSIPDHGSSVLFGMLSFRAIVAALAFSGLGGLASMSAELSPAPTLLVAGSCGILAMFGVYLLMSLLSRLRTDGTVHIERAVGCPATVYLSIPAEKAGKGKVHLSLQSRLCEYQAVTSSAQPLLTGAKVVVIGIVGPGTLEVEPAVPQASKPEPAVAGQA